MQRSHSMHINLSVADLEAVSSPSSAGVGLANGRVNGTNGRINGTSMPRGASVSIPRVGSGATILGILDPRSYQAVKGRRGGRFQKEACVHLIPFVVLLCYFCLWIASSEVAAPGDEFAKGERLYAEVPASSAPTGLQVDSQFEDQILIFEGGVIHLPLTPKSKGASNAT